MRQIILPRGQFAAVCLVFTALSLCAGRRAEAQGLGLQGGVTIDPEQIYVGSHFETGELFPRFHFRPGIDGGFGENSTLASINVEFVYRIPIAGGSWAFYQGGGPAILLLRQRGSTIIGSRNTTSVHAGTIWTVGFAHENGFFTEFKFGTGTSPALRFGVGYTLRP
jgi:hypothetical protein